MLFQIKFVNIYGNYHTPQAQSTVRGSFTMNRDLELDVLLSRCNK